MPHTNPTGVLVSNHRTTARGTTAFPAWPFVLIGILVVSRAVAYWVALAAGYWTAPPGRFVPYWVPFGQATLFVALGTLLLWSGRMDRRAWSLGVFLIDSACTLIDPYVYSFPYLTPLLALATQIRPDAFQAAMLWFFATEFPLPAVRGWLSAFITSGLIFTLALGCALAGLDAFVTFGSGALDSGWLGEWARLVQRHSALSSDWFFTLQFVSLVPLLLLLPLKFQECDADERRRFKWLAWGIAVGIFPLMLEVFLSTAVSGYVEATQASPYRETKGAVIFAALTVLPVIAAYAALVQQTLRLRVAIGLALQYLLARSVVRAFSVAPILLIVFLVITNRDRSVADLLTGTIGIAIGLTGMGAIGISVWRRRLMWLVDRHFFREPIDTKAALTSFAEGAREARTTEMFAIQVRTAVEHTFHATRVAVAIAGPGDALHVEQTGTVPLSRQSVLAQLISGTDSPLVIEDSALALVSRLRDHDQQWLNQTEARLVVPLRGSRGDLLGAVAMGPKRGEQDYSSGDRAILAAASVSWGISLERLLSWGTGDPLMMFAEPPGWECVTCSRVLAHDATECACGGVLQRAAVPLHLGDRLTFLQRLGAGGMGVVYKAVDNRIQQERAVKTLSRTEPALAQRLTQEAQAMAAATHPNLAIVHGLEIWRDIPLLVMEYLPGGTLATRLRQAPVPPATAVSWGLQLALALQAVHQAGMLHRDIKPSNIGFTTNDTPKLLDFGLARLIPADPALASTLSTRADSTASIASDPAAIRGTPAYLSPEILGGDEPGERDDIWSFSLTLLEMCLGRNPLQAATVPATVMRVLAESGRVADHADGLPAPLPELFHGLLGPLSSRPARAHELIDRLKLVTVIPTPKGDA